MIVDAPDLAAESRDFNGRLLETLATMAGVETLPPGTPSRRAWRSRLVLTTESMRWFSDCFLRGVELEARRVPEISPLYADLHGLPPALFAVGTCDPLLDDSLFVHARRRAAGNEAELRGYAEAAHGFNLFPLGVAHRANDEQHAFLREAFA